ESYRPRRSSESGAGPAALRETVQRREEMKRLPRRPRVVPGRPPRGLLGGDGASQDELAVPRARQLLGQPRHFIGRHVGEDGRRFLVVLVLEPGETIGPAQDRDELGGVAFPAGGPALLVGVLGAGLEEEAHGAAGDGDLEVAVLLVAALVV